MRLVQITIPTGKREAVLRTLDREGVDYVVTDETSRQGYAAVVYVPLPTTAVEPVLAELREAGLDEEAYTVVLNAETVVSRDFERLSERYEAEGEDRIAREEVAAAAEEMAPPLSIYAGMTIISAVIATAGLLMDSPAVVVGSMVIAPLVGPAMSSAVGTVLDDNELFVRGMKLQIIGILLTVASAAVFGWLIKELHLIPPFTDVTAISEIRERLSPDFLSLVVALGAGAAGVVSLTSGVSTALVGVMIAVALVPPGATVGIGLAWGLPTVVLGAGVLALVNWLSINLAAQVVLWQQGYRPKHWFKLSEARSVTLKRVAIFLLAISVLSVFLGGVTYDSFTNAQTDQQIRSDVETVVADTADVSLLDVEVRHTDGQFFTRPEAVFVTVAVPPGTPPDGLASRIDASVERVVDGEIQTRVQYLTTEVDSVTERRTTAGTNTTTATTAETNVVPARSAVGRSDTTAPLPATTATSMDQAVT